MFKQVRLSGTITDGREEIVPGQIDTFIQMFCNFPEDRRKRSIETVIKDVVARGYHITVSNDGTLFSDEDTIVIFDSNCVECTNEHNITCTVKVNILYS